MAKAKLDNAEISENYISIGLGLLVVVVIGILLYNYFTNRTKQPEKVSEETISEEATTSAKPGSTYTVVEGDTLWSISEKSYGTGFNWQEIAKANNLGENASLEAGQKLEIPVVSSPQPEVSQAPEATPVAQAVESSPTLPETGVTEPTPAPEKVTITGSTYTVVAGDTLWDIACRAYGDCYAWSRIAEANKLVNPNLIHPGNEFTLPR